jgi:hypothetical protein
MNEWMNSFELSLKLKQFAEKPLMDKLISIEEKPVHTNIHFVFSTV